MAEEQPQLKRDGTMQVTAKEGIEYLKREGKEELIPENNSNGNAPEESNGDKPEIPRDGTMEATIKDGKQFLESTGGELPEDVRTRGDQEKVETEEETPAVVRDNTMVATAKAGEEFLGEDKPLGETRTQSKAIADAQEEENGGEEEADDDDEDSKEEEDEDETAALKRTHTMAETLEEGEAFLKKQKTNGDGEEVTEAS